MTYENELIKKEDVLVWPRVRSGGMGQLRSFPQYELLKL